MQLERTKNTNKKIILLITKSNFGGAQRYVLDLAVKLKKDRYDIKVAMGGNGILFDKLKAHEIPTIPIPKLHRDVSLLNELSSFFFLYNLFRKEKPDIIHLNSSKSGLGALAGRLVGVPKIIFTLHGLALNEERSVFQKTIIKFLYFLTITLCHKTIVVSDALKSQTLKVIPFVKKKITTIYNGIDSQNFLSKPIAREKIKKHIKDSDKIDFQIASLSLGTIGELHKIKGHSYLLEGFKEALTESALPLYLFIVGDGEEKEYLRKQIEELELKKNVFLCGYIDNAVDTIKAFDIFILPSLSEGLPYVVLEAGSAGVATIATKVGGIPEIIQDGENGILIESKSKESITDAIITLAFDHHVRKTLGNNLNTKVTNDFTLEKMLKETKSIYNI